MLRRFTSLFAAVTPAGGAAGGEMGLTDGEVREVPASPLSERLMVLDRDPYLYVADRSQKLISIFDDLKYDRSDMDMMSGPMRQRIIDKAKGLGFKQVSGRVLESRADDVRMIFPKFTTLGASPFDIARYTERRVQDYLVLTPTQTACQIIDNYNHDQAVERIRDLIAQQPINIYRLMDYLELKPAHQEFMNAIGHLKLVQREALESEHLQGRRALGSIG
ncbi:MAG: hypothetical protein AAF556_01575 [Pseudomonadota bacterium]